ncbi:MAG: bifunctional DNA-formamidopyrimidine glycosylase/DNA-(apurinic or apyrimidinic site) lyase [Candidatus Gygaella obscura]|nr:bifunctional DNA-formamidopyrimidine glycosylase/DNA-(apurinic or apyrimidinic site) lyase [Candidatus Gygaella obscura]
MPELPEVETIKRELISQVVNKKIIAVFVNNTKVIKDLRKSDFIRQVKGSSIKRIIRKGKLLIFELSNSKSLAVHLRMTGQLVYPGDNKKSRVSFKFSDNSLLDYKDQRILGELRLVRDWREINFIKCLGPEPFDLTVRGFESMLANRKTKIKPLLMDQKFIAGLGNIYAAEALFRAGINPLRPASNLSSEEKKKLFNQITKILKQAIRCKGSSIDQYIQISGEPGDYVKHHKVYDREGNPCFVCKTTIKRISLAGRGTYFCPKCQK